MFKRVYLALAVVAALTLGVGMPNQAKADHGHHGHHGHHGWHGHHGHHHHWHGYYRRPIVYPPIYVGGYYPVRSYYAAPYYPYGYPYGGYFGYYGPGVGVSVGW